MFILLCYSFTNRQIEVSSAFESKTEDQDLCRCMPTDQSPRIILNVDLYSISLWSSNSTTRQQRKEQRDWESACRSYQDNSEFHAVRLLVGEEYYTSLSPSWPVFSSIVHIIHSSSHVLCMFLFFLSTHRFSYSPNDFGRQISYPLTQYQESTCLMKN